MNKDTFDRVLSELREPVSKQQVEQATSRVLKSLEASESPRLIPVMVSAGPRTRSLRWKAVAAAAVVLVFAAVLPFMLRSPGRNDFIASRNGRLLALTDGSQVELSLGAKISVSKAGDGLRVFLSEGGVIVTAAKQHGGHLYIETKDCVVSVVGTVFSVSAGPEGSRVSVVEGEVEVRQGETKKTLLPGQQVSTAPAAVPVSIATDIEWSSQAAELVALLQQQSASPPLSVSPAPPAPSIPVPTQNLERTIHGIVTSPGTGEGIAGVTVSLCPDPEVQGLVTRTEDGRVLLSMTFDTAFARSALRCDSAEKTTTDAMGRYVFRDVDAGRYVVRVQKSGYVPSLDHVQPPLQEFVQARNAEGWTYEGAPIIAAQSVTMGADLRPADASIVLTRAATLSGKVRIADRNRFAEYVLVQLGTLTKAGAFKSLTNVNSNNSGGYRFRVPPGEYVLFSGALDLAAVAIPADAIRVVVKEGEEITVDNLVYRQPSPR
jgi:hypothetical protein